LRPRGRVCCKAIWLRPPRATFIFKLILGKLLVETATMSCRVTNAKAKRVLGWSPRYPSFKEGLAATVAAIECGEVTA
jgi:nucleoside-diphosphate-sugar epimerase